MSNDLISRRAVGKIIQKEIERTSSYAEHDTQINILYKVEALTTAYDIDAVIDEVRGDCYSMGLDESQTEIIIDDIKQGMEERSTNDKWIPCSEMLPKNRENVLVCWGADNISVGYFVDGGAGGWFFEQLAGGYKIPYEPSAWQPLPAAYKSRY